MSFKMRLPHKLEPDVRKATLAEIGRTGLKNFRPASVVVQFEGLVPKQTAYRLVKRAIEDIRSGNLRNFQLPHQSAAERMREALSELDAALRRVTLELGNLARTQEIILSEVLATPPEIRARIIGRMRLM
jgi:hypothetical protein